MSKTINVSGITQVVGGKMIESSEQSITVQDTHEPTNTLPAANAGDLTTRTDADTGVVTADSSEHGITASDTVNVFWADGVRYGMDVSDVTDDAITVDGGAGDDLPTQDTAVFIAAQVSIGIGFDGDNLSVIDVMADARAHVDFQDSGSSSLKAVELSANNSWRWVTGTGTTPITGNAVAAVLASAGTAAATELNTIVGYDNTP